MKRGSAAEEVKGEFAPRYGFQACADEEVKREGKAAPLEKDR